MDLATYKSFPPIIVTNQSGSWALRVGHPEQLDFRSTGTNHMVHKAVVFFMLGARFVMFHTLLVFHGIPFASH